jgi:branched-chain amino acid transport system permease protein
MVYGVLKLINFAHGDVMMVGCYFGYWTATNLPKSAGQGGFSFFQIVLVFLAAMVGCALLGFTIERFAYRPLRDKPRLTALITAIGVSFALSFGFQLDIGFLPGAAPKAFPELIRPKEVLIIGDHDVVIWNWQLLSFLIAMGLMLGLEYLVYRTRFGRAMRAVSYDHKISGLMGIPTDRVIALTFRLGSALAACAGILYAIKDTAIQPLMGLYVGLKAFVAAVIGGIGHVPGAMIGGLLLGLIEEFVVGYSASSWRDAVAFAFLVIVLLVRPQGLFGRTAPEKV